MKIQHIWYIICYSWTFSSQSTVESTKSRSSYNLLNDGLGHVQVGRPNKQQNLAAEFGSSGVMKPGAPLVRIINDGPTILGANTTYHASLNEVLPLATYSCSWTEWKCGRLIPEWTVSETISNTCNTTSRYNCPEDLGSHTMYLVVLQDDPVKEVADSSSEVDISEHINTLFTIKQEAILCNTSSNCSLATNKSMQMSVDIHDPSHFFKGAAIEYMWSFSDGYSEISSEPLIFHNYSSPGLYTMQVNITAILPDNSTQKYGYVTYPMQLLDSISNLTIKGTSDTMVGSSVQYNVSCNGSVPVSFCWSIIHNQDNDTYMDNNTCIWTLSSQFCNTSFRYQFNSSGTYHLRAKAVNDVSEEVSERNINVSKVNVAAYSSIAAALVFGILLSVVSIAVVVHSYRKERMRHVEVANFDFQRDERSDSLSNFARRLRHMVTPPPTSADEKLRLVENNQKVASELNVL